MLFLFLLGELILHPYVEQTAGPLYYLFRSLTIGVTLASVYAVSFRRGLIFIALLLALPVIVERSVFLRSELGAMAMFISIANFTFDLFVVVVIFRRVFARENPTGETIFGAVCIYLLLGFTFARLYAVVAAVQPHAFYLDPTTNSRSVPTSFDFVTFSFGSMTTAGAAGITAVSPGARSVSMLESILGVLYLAVMISRLIDAYRPSYSGSGNGSDQDGPED